MNQGEFNPNEIVGMELYTAFVWVKQFDHSIRVVRKNGNDCIFQRNTMPDRINVATQDDLIVEILSYG